MCITEENEVMQSFSSKNSFELVVDGIGRHIYCATIKDVQNKTVKLPLIMKVKEYPTASLMAILSNSQSSPLYVGRTMLLTANVRSGNGGYTCQFEDTHKKYQIRM